MMVMGAVTGFGVALITGSAWLGLIAAIIVGALFTALVQSSSATTAVVIVLAGQGGGVFRTGRHVDVGAAPLNNLFVRLIEQQHCRIREHRPGNGQSLALAFNNAFQFSALAFVVAIGGAALMTRPRATGGPGRGRAIDGDRACLGGRGEAG